MSLLFILLLLRHYVFPKEDAQISSPFESVMLHLAFVYDFACFFYQEEMSELASQIKLFLKTTITLELGWFILLVLILSISFGYALGKFSK